LRAKDRTTLSLAAQIVEYFGGAMALERSGRSLTLSISLPAKIKVKGHYGGMHSKDPHRNA